MLPPPMQSSLPAGWLAFTGRASNPLDRYERFQLVLTFIPLSCSPDANGLSLLAKPITTVAPSPTFDGFREELNPSYARARYDSYFGNATRVYSVPTRQLEPMSTENWSVMRPLLIAGAMAVSLFPGPAAAQNSEEV